jgi:methyl-accepting chemotaxis protein
MLRKLRISTVSTVVGLAVIVGFAASVGSVFYALKKFDPSGPVSGRIQHAQDLVADVMPPALYIGEAFLEATLIVREPWSFEPRKQRLLRLAKDYNERRTYWLSQDIDPGIRSEIESGSHHPAAFFWETLDQRFMPAIEKGDTEAANDAYLSLADSFENQKAKIEELVTSAEASRKRTISEAITEEQQIVLYVAGLGAVVLAFIIGAVASVIFGIVRPIDTMRLAMQKLAAGDHGADIRYVNRHDEIGDMAKALAVFRDSLGEAERLRDEQRAMEVRQAEQRKAELRKLADNFEQAVGSIVGVVATASTELGRTAEELTQSARTTSSRSGAVAEASEEASRNVMTVATAAEQLSDSIREISSQVMRSSTMASKAAQEAAETTGQVRGLSEAAERIGGIVELINQIASQTSLLALNATIEAARAGEAGRGFAVVASEVKQLSERTAKATEEIASQITAIQEKTQQAANSIDGIAKTVSELDSVATSIASAVEQQGVATENIARNVEEASSGTMEVARNITGVTEAAEGSSAAAMEVLSAARDLSEQSDALRNEVNRFLRTVRAA